MSQGLYRRLVVKSVVTESESAKSFYLVSEDGSDLAPHLPGQHLPIRLEIPGQARTVFRCYTISNFDNSCYRLSIKKELPPPDRADVSHGVSSGYFHDLVKPGMTIEAKTPAGNFWLDLDRNHPVVMIAGGIGVTPMMSMLEALARTRSRRNVYFFFGLRHSADHVFKDRLNEITRECTGLRMKIYYEAARPGDVHGRDYHATGRIDLKEVRSSLPAVNMEYFLCGPPPMLNAISSGLVADGVARENIRTETFGPSSVALRDLISSDEVARSAFQQAAGVTVTFKRSAVSVPWTGEVPSLLQLAEANGVEISSGCQYGDCGTCMTRLLEGKVKYLHPTGARPDPGHCLPCSCEPDGPISLDV